MDVPTLAIQWAFLPTAPHAGQPAAHEPEHVAPDPRLIAEAAAYYQLAFACLAVEAGLAQPARQDEERVPVAAGHKRIAVARHGEPDACVEPGLARQVEESRITRLKEILRYPGPRSTLLWLLIENADTGVTLPGDRLAYGQAQSGLIALRNVFGYNAVVEREGKHFLDSELAAQVIPVADAIKDQKPGLVRSPAELLHGWLQKRSSDAAWLLGWLASASGQPIHQVDGWDDQRMHAAARVLRNKFGPNFVLGALDEGYRVNCKDPHWIAFTKAYPGHWAAARPAQAACGHPVPPGLPPKIEEPAPVEQDSAFADLDVPELPEIPDTKAPQLQLAPDPFDWVSRETPAGKEFRRVLAGKESSKVAKTLRAIVDKPSGFQVRDRKGFPVKEQRHAILKLVKKGLVRSIAQPRSNHVLYFLHTENLRVPDPDPARRCDDRTKLLDIWLKAPGGKIRKSPGVRVMPWTRVRGLIAELRDEHGPDVVQDVGDDVFAIDSSFFTAQAGKPQP